MSHGVISPPLRIVPPEGASISGHALPGGVSSTVPPLVYFHLLTKFVKTIVGMSSCLVHLNENKFPEARTFRPERWLEPGAKDLEQYLDVFGSWDALRGHAEQILDQYANADIVEELRWRRKEDGPLHGDMVFENAILFMRDMLVTREFDDAVKCGDSGRVVTVLKVWALFFRGCGRTKYAHEMLHLIHNISKVWPKPIVYVLLILSSRLN